MIPTWFELTGQIIPVIVSEVFMNERTNALGPTGSPTESGQTEPTAEPTPAAPTKQLTPAEVVFQIAKAVGIAGQVQECRARCGVELYFFPTAKGKLQPIEAKTGLPHWGNCPRAEVFRRAQRRTLGSDL